MLLDFALGVQLVSTTNRRILYIRIIYAASPNALGFRLGRAARFHNKPTYNIYYSILYEVTQCSWTHPWVCGSFSNKPAYNIFYSNIREVTQCSWIPPWVCGSFST